jgi:hypothetical protein
VEALAALVVLALMPALMLELEPELATLLEMRELAPMLATRSPEVSQVFLAAQEPAQELMLVLEPTTPQLEQASKSPVVSRVFLALDVALLLSVLRLPTCMITAGFEKSPQVEVAHWSAMDENELTYMGNKLFGGWNLEERVWS